MSIIITRPFVDDQSINQTRNKRVLKYPLSFLLFSPKRMLFRLEAFLEDLVPQRIESLMLIVSIMWVILLFEIDREADSASRKLLLWRPDVFESIMGKELTS